MQFLARYSFSQVAKNRQRTERELLLVDPGKLILPDDLLRIAYSLGKPCGLARSIIRNHDMVKDTVAKRIHGQGIEDRYLADWKDVPDVYRNHFANLGMQLTGNELLNAYKTREEHALRLAITEIDYEEDPEWYSCNLRAAYVEELNALEKDDIKITCRRLEDVLLDYQEAAMDKDFRRNTLVSSYIWGESAGVVEFWQRVNALPDWSGYAIPLDSNNDKNNRRRKKKKKMPATRGAWDWAMPTPATALRPIKLRR